MSNRFATLLSHVTSLKSRDLASTLPRHHLDTRITKKYGTRWVTFIRPNMTRVFIGRLSINARESDVERFLRGYGKVRDISLKRGYGFVVR